MRPYWHSKIALWRVVPDVWFDATFPKVREGDRAYGMAWVVAIGIRETGEREEAVSLPFAY